MKKMLFIMNPYAGQKKGTKSLAQIVEIFNRAGYEVNMYMTAGQGDAEIVTAKRAKGNDLIVCCGGDGTFNEVAAGLLESGEDVALGYIPAGSTNDFASSLGLSLDCLQAARDIVNGQSRQVDVGVFGGRYFSYVASFGAFTRASYATPQSLKNALGHGAYVLGGIAEITQLKTEHVRLELPDGRVIEDDFLFGAVSNSTSVGGVLNLKEDQVDLSDGKLEIMLVKAPKDLAELADLVGALQKQTYNCAAMTFLSAESLKVKASRDMDWTLDGERQPGVEEVEIRCMQKALRVVGGKRAK